MPETDQDPFKRHSRYYDVSHLTGPGREGAMPIAALGPVCWVVMTVVMMGLPWPCRSVTPVLWNCVFEYAFGVP